MEDSKIQRFILLAIPLSASYIPDPPPMQLDPIDTVKAVVVYALGEWSTTLEQHHYNQNTPLPSYAFKVCNIDSFPSVLHYYNEVSCGAIQRDGCDGHNRKASSGVYFVRLACDGTQTVVKALIK